MKNFKRIDNLVIRASYGIQGNIDKNTSSYVMGTYKNISMLPGITEELISLDSPPNKRLRWEKTKTMNFGTDIALFNNALNVTVDYYLSLIHILHFVEVLHGEPATVYDLVIPGPELLCFVQQGHQTVSS